MRIVTNPFRGGSVLVPGVPRPAADPSPVQKLLARCPEAAETPLVDGSSIAPVSELWVKDERNRMGLGSFKALGAAYVMGRQAEAAGPNGLSGHTFVTASAGNHGLSVAAGARVFGAKSVVFIAETVPESFAKRLEGEGAEVRRHGVDYAASMEGALGAAAENGWTLLSDSSWDGYIKIPYMLMEGYLALGAEIANQIRSVPTHIFLQAGVGGMAGAIAAFVRRQWGNDLQIIVVEPEAAPALQASILAGKPVFADGPVSSMGRLDCKEPSLIALNGLGHDADVFLTLTDSEVEDVLPLLTKNDLQTSPSGGAGLCAALRPDVREAVEIGPDARILAILSEGAS